MSCPTAPLTCPPDEWQCNSSQCIPSRWRCDGSFDCADLSDELGCPPHHVAPDDVCHFSGEFRCRSSGQCIHDAWVCDSDPDCEDGSDEANCEWSLFSTLGGCIWYSDKCDLHPSCVRVLQYMICLSWSLPHHTTSVLTAIFHVSLSWQLSWLVCRQSLCSFQKRTFWNKRHRFL